MSYRQASSRTYGYQKAGFKPPKLPPGYKTGLRCPFCKKLHQEGRVIWEGKDATGFVNYVCDGKPYQHTFEEIVSTSGERVVSVELLGEFNRDTNDFKTQLVSPKSIVF